MFLPIVQIFLSYQPTLRSGNDLNVTDQSGFVRITTMLETNLDNV